MHRLLEIVHQKNFKAGSSKIFLGMGTQLRLLCKDRAASRIDEEKAKSHCSMTVGSLDKNQKASHKYVKNRLHKRQKHGRHTN